MFARLDKHRDVGLLILRLGFGLGFFFFHGLPKLTTPSMWEPVGSAMGNFGIHFGYQWFGLAAALAESIGGLMFAAGLFFRPVSLALSFTMLVAATNHVASGQGEASHAIKNLFVFLGMFVAGPGRYSLDSMLFRRGRAVTDPEPDLRR